MKHFLYYLLLGLGLPSFAQKPTIDQLRTSIVSKLSQIEGDFALAFKDLQTQQTLFINEKESFHAASTMKTPVMMEVFRQAQAGKFNLSDSILVKNEFKSIVDGSPFKLDISDDSADDMYKKIGSKMTIYDLTYQMIIVSSNLATNILIDLVDAKKANQFMRELGAKDINVLRGVEDTKAFEKGLSNTTTAYDLMLIFEKIAQKQAVSTTASDKMIQILLDQKFNEMIPKHLPSNAKVAHKTGSITGVRHDWGIVFLPNGKAYVLVLLSKKLTKPEVGVNAMAEVSEMIYDFVK